MNQQTNGCRAREYLQPTALEEAEMGEAAIQVRGLRKSFG